MNRLFDYLEGHGILLCNVNPYLPSLEDIGSGWKEVTELLDAQLIFYSKAFKGRTSYLSREAYLLLDMVRDKKPLTAQAAMLYELLEGNPPADTGLLKEAAGHLMSLKAYQAAFNFLLKERYITVVKNGAQLNENWSGFLYGTAEAWAMLAPGLEDLRKLHQKKTKAEAITALRRLFGTTMKEKQFCGFVGLPPYGSGKAAVVET